MKLSRIYSILTRELYRNTDVCIFSYPKSGRTWLRTILAKYLELQFGEPFNIELHNTNNPKIPKIAFSHILFNVNMYRNKKSIFLFRDPRDVVVSYYHHLKKREKKFDGDISHFIRNKRYGFKRIIFFMNKILKKKENTKSLLVSYESLKKSTYSEIRRILLFLDLTISEKKLIESIRFSDFKNMKKMEMSEKFNNGRLKPLDKKDSNSYKVRKGKIGSYKEELSNKDIIYLNKNMKELNSFYKIYYDF